MDANRCSWCGHDEDWCNEVNPLDGTRCTRPKGHTGPHVACGLISTKPPQGDDVVGFGYVLHKMSEWGDGGGRMKIVRIASCANCPYAKRTGLHQYYCYWPELEIEKDGGDLITEYVDSDTLPAWCPLEEE